ncbi:MAG: exodeoxyribonuclease small subunit, partial [Frankiaceae bacterium]|nr:exodeoxyribonuclease small subunit [Frankiaceae bacterium]
RRRVRGGAVMTKARDTTNGSNVSDETPSYEQARDELAEVVRALETGGVTLEESLALWERGEQLARICEQWLEGARTRLQAVVDAEADE